MRVSKNQVTLLSAAVAALFAVGAQAQTALTFPNNGIATPGGTNGKVFAREYVSGTNLYTGVNTLNANGVVGVGTSTSQNRYMRFRLSNATWLVPPTLTVANGTPTIASGGTANSSNVVYQVTASAANPILVADVFVLGINTITIASTAGAATLTYEAYETLVAAQAGTPVLYSSATNLASFAPVVGFTSTATQNQTASAISSYLNLTGGPGNATTARVGQVNLATTPLSTAANSCPGSLPCLADGVTNAFIANVLLGSGSNVVSVSGDFSAAASAASVTLGGTAASAVTATTATIPLTSAQAAGFTNANINYVVNGTTALPVSAYGATFTGTAQTGFAVSPLSITTTGRIDRDGVTYESPWVTSSTGWISRFFLTQTTTATVPWTAVVRNAAGLVTGGTLSGTLVGGRVTQITVASLLPADTTAFPGPYQVTFNIAADATATQGTYVVTPPNLGSAVSTPLYRAANR